MSSDVVHCTKIRHQNKLFNKQRLHHLNMKNTTGMPFPDCTVTGNAQTLNIWTLQSAYLQCIQISEQGYCMCQWPSVNAQWHILIHHNRVSRPNENDLATHCVLSASYLHARNRQGSELTYQAQQYSVNVKPISLTEGDHKLDTQCALCLEIHTDAHTTALHIRSSTDVWLCPHIWAHFVLLNSLILRSCAPIRRIAWQDMLLISGE